MSNIQELLNHIDPASLNYSEWIAVGMAIKHEGLSVTLWDEWSRRDTARYKHGEPERRWNGFTGSSQPVTGGTLNEFAKRSGWKPNTHEAIVGRVLDWDAIVTKDSFHVLEPEWLEERTVIAPNIQTWRPAHELYQYISTLFQGEEHVGYVTECWKNGDKLSPKIGVYSKTASQLIEELTKCGGDICNVIGDYNREAGAWIRFNPLDGQGVKDSNVTAFRYALVESDTIEIDRQRAIYEQLELPIAALVHSGKKSLHAIVRVDATSKEEYRERVNFLHQVCLKNGLEIDTQNKNPSRLSRLPGVIRNDSPQFLVGTNLGKRTWEEWKIWVVELNDNLPDIKPLSNSFLNPPNLSTELVENLLRIGHKMLLAGPSKAGKSFALLQLAMAIAEGKDWMGWKCRKGRVLYINLELDEASCIHRVIDLYKAKDWQPTNIADIEFWHLRGMAAPLNALVPKLVYRAKAKGFSAIIIDPIYKVSTGDENDAHAVAMFCNQLDRIASELNTSVIYCHHHSKGAQGQKSAQDRSSGSGVFARDADSILDLIELNIEPKHKSQIKWHFMKRELELELDASMPQWRTFFKEQDRDQFMNLVQKHIDPDIIDTIDKNTNKKSEEISAWRLEGTLREFAPFGERVLFFHYPIHTQDMEGILHEAKANGEETPWQAQARIKAEENKKFTDKYRELVMSTFCLLAGIDNEEVHIGDMIEKLNEQIPGKTEKAMKLLIAKNSKYIVCKDDVVRTSDEAKRHEFRQALDKAKDIHGNVNIKDVVKHCKKSIPTIRNYIALNSDLWSIDRGMIIEKENKHEN